MKITKDHVGMTGTITAHVTIDEHAPIHGGAGARIFVGGIGWLPPEVFDFTPDPASLPTGLGARIRLDSGAVLTRISSTEWASNDGSWWLNYKLASKPFTVLFEGDTRTEASDV